MRIVSLIMALLVFGCGSQDTSKQADGGSNTQFSVDSIQPGYDFKFSCQDTFNQTTLTVTCSWNDIKKNWNILLQEKNQTGKIELDKSNLIGLPSLFPNMMDVMAPNSKYALIQQKNKNLADYRDGNRVIECRF